MTDSRATSLRYPVRGRESHSLLLVFALWTNNFTTSVQRRYLCTACCRTWARRKDARRQRERERKREWENDCFQKLDVWMPKKRDFAAANGDWDRTTADVTAVESSDWSNGRTKRVTRVYVISAGWQDGRHGDFDVRMARLAQSLPGGRSKATIAMWITSLPFTGRQLVSWPREWKGKLLAGNCTSEAHSVSYWRSKNINIVLPLLG